MKAKELLDFLKDNMRAYTNKEGIKLELVNRTAITTTAGLGFIHGVGYKAKLLTDPVEPEPFIESYKLKSIQDLDKIAEGYLWIRYLIGKAAVSYELEELKATFTFRIVNSKTILYCPAFHFYDEHDVLFTTERQFSEYLEQNKARLEIAAKRRKDWV